MSAENPGSPDSGNQGVIESARGVERSDRSVLIVDDDWRVRELVQLVLEEYGFSVTTAGDGDTAITLISQKRPGVLVLDLSLPGADGFAVAEAARKVHGDGVPIVVLTADGSPAERANQIGAVGYMSKPFDIDDLTALVGRALEQS